MFRSIDSKEFGRYLFELRKKLKLTQAYIAEETGINTDTMRKIENGIVIPKYDTLAILSSVYKIDLCKKFSEYQEMNSLMTLYHRIDLCLLSNDVEGVREVLKFLCQEACTLSQQMINKNELVQFKVYIEVLIVHMARESQLYRELVLKLHQALELTLGKFNIEKLKTYRLNAFELRILILYAAILTNHDQYNDSVTILKVLLDWSDYLFSEERLTVRYKIKIHFNLAYNFHCLNRYEASLLQAEAGIELSKKHGYLNDLHALYYRKFTAEYYLKSDQQMDSLKKCIQLMSALGNDHLLEQYLKITKELYGIDGRCFV